MTSPTSPAGYNAGWKKGHGGSKSDDKAESDDEHRTKCGKGDCHEQSSHLSKDGELSPVGKQTHQYEAETTPAGDKAEAHGMGKGWGKEQGKSARNGKVTSKANPEGNQADANGYGKAWKAEQSQNGKKNQFGTDENPDGDLADADDYGKEWKKQQAKTESKGYGNACKKQAGNPAADPGYGHEWKVGQTQAQKPGAGSDGKSTPDDDQSKSQSDYANGKTAQQGAAAGQESWANPDGPLADADGYGLEFKKEQEKKAAAAKGGKK